MRLLVTGATGFIGGAIARGAASRGFEVATVHRGVPPAGLEACESGTWEEWLASPPREPFDAMIHAAAVRHRPGIPAGEYVRTNGDLTAKALRISSRLARRFVLVSSISVYGWPSRLPIDESFPDAPVGEYGRSKADSERMVRESGQPFVIVQPSITYGPGDTNGMMEKILRMVAGRFFVVPGLGRSRVQLVYIDDLADMTLAACATEASLGQRFIATFRDPIAVADLVRLSSRAVGKWIPPFGPPVALLRMGALALEALDRAGLFGGREPPLTREKLATISVDRCYRTARMRAILGTEPRVGYEEGIGRTARALGLA